MSRAMGSRGNFRWLAKFLLGAGLLALLLAVFQPHDHPYSSGSNSNHSCVACKVNDHFGGVPTISIVVHKFIPLEPVGLLIQFESAHADVLLTSGPPRAPPHSA